MSKAYKSISPATGQSARKPSDIPKKGWKEISSRIALQIKKDHLQIVAAGVAFYFFLALFPTIAAAISIYGLVMSPAEVQQQMGQLTAVLPEEAYSLISNILEQFSSESQQTLGWSLAISILFSLWSANKGTSALFEGINIAYNELDERSFFAKNGLTLLFTLGGILIGLLGLTVVAGVPALLDSFSLNSTVKTLIQWLRWPVILIIIFFALGLTYKMAPDRVRAKFRWVSTGAILATIFWLLGSLLFSLYVNNFGSFSETYASFAAVVILMLWFFLTSFIILLGAEVNAEMEHQTAMDTTIGEEEPMGQRGGYYPDHVADEKPHSRK
jgi:membrane protein